MTRLTLQIFMALCMGTLTLPATARTDTLRGRAVRITDGDTFTLLDSANRQHRIRLHGIDCPEQRQPFFQQSRQFAARLLMGRNLRVATRGSDRYGRVIGIVVLPDGAVLNELLLSAGLAWHFRRHDRNPRWARLEQEAREAKRGLWADASPVAPWDWRSSKSKGGATRN